MNRNYQSIKHKKAESLLTEGVSAFYFVSIPVTTRCNYISAYPHLVAIIMYAIFHKIITKNLITSLSIFIICFFFDSSIHV